MRGIQLTILVLMVLFGMIAIYSGIIGHNIWGMFVGGFAFGAIVTLLIGEAYDR